MTVHVLRIEHKHGSDTTVYSTAKKAEKWLFEYVKENWDEWTGDNPGALPKLDTIKDEGEAIDAYFEATQCAMGAEEFYQLEELEVDGA